VRKLPSSFGEFADPSRKQMGSTSFGAIVRRLIRPTALQEIEAIRGSNGCAMASDLP
jgi:hypothetical protein